MKTNSRILRVAAIEDSEDYQRVISHLLTQINANVNLVLYNDATTIINNCDRYVYMGGMDLSICRNIAERTGVSLPDILYMPLGREYVFERGSRPVFTERFHITDDKEWRQLHSRSTD